MDESRKQFEKVVTGRAEASGYVHMNNLLKRDGNRYSTTWVDMMWEGWQASRESMKPSGTCVLTVTNSTGEAISISDVIGFEVVEYKGA